MHTKKRTRHYDMEQVLLVVMGGAVALFLLAKSIERSQEPTLDDRANEVAQASLTLEERLEGWFESGKLLELENVRINSAVDKLEDHLAAFEAALSTDTNHLIEAIETCGRAASCQTRVEALADFNSLVANKYQPRLDEANRLIAEAGEATADP